MSGGGGKGGGKRTSMVLKRKEKMGKGLYRNIQESVCTRDNWNVHASKKEDFRGNEYF